MIVCRKQNFVRIATLPSVKIVVVLADVKYKLGIKHWGRNSASFVLWYACTN